MIPINESSLKIESSSYPNIIAPYNSSFSFISKSKEIDSPPLKVYLYLLAADKSLDGKAKTFPSS